MGVKGLKTFIDENDRVLLHNFSLCDTYLIFDANNFKTILFMKTHARRQDLYGSDHVAFADRVRQVIRSMKKCRIKPIFVYDGAKDSKIIADKSKTQFDRAVQKLKGIEKLHNNQVYNQILLPPNTYATFNNVATEEGCHIVMAMFEADLTVARLANLYKAPVVSNDSDFLLMDLPYGVITCDNLDLETIHTNYRPGSGTPPYILSSIYFIDEFVRCFPDLDRRTLPLLGVLCGNDFVDPSRFETFCNQLSLKLVAESCDRNKINLRRNIKSNHLKILRILLFLSGKSLEQAINRLCESFPNVSRKKVKKYVKDNLESYQIPEDDYFEFELYDTCLDNFTRYHPQFEPNLLKSKAKNAAESLTDWFEYAFGKLSLSGKILEILHRNTIYIMPTLDDINQLSARSCQMRVYRVLLKLTSLHPGDNRQLVIYDRVDRRYGPITVKPMSHLEKFGKLSYVLYDIPKMDKDSRDSITLATFHCSPKEFLNGKREILLGDHEFASSFVILKLVLEYIDREDGSEKLPNYFRLATLVTFLYYTLFYKYQRNHHETPSFINGLGTLIANQKLKYVPRLGGRRKYNIRLVHMISKLQHAIGAFNLINSFLGETLPRIRTDIWLNCCLIYNLAEYLKETRFTTPKYVTSRVVKY